MKTIVYKWRLSAEKKADLKDAARREGISLGALLNRVVGEWLASRRARRLKT
jgi:hypothetical protein